MRWLPLVLLASACTVAKGSGVMVSEDYDVSSSITGVGNHTFFNVTLEEGPPRATATCDDNIIDNLTFDEVQGVLELRMNPSGSYNPSSSCTVELTLSEVAVVHNNGSGNLSSPFDFAALEEVRVTGSGDVDLRGAGGDPLKTTVSGSGSLKLVGAAGEVRAKNSGSGATEIGLVGGQLEANVQDAGSMSVLAVNDDFVGRVSGSGGLILRNILSEEGEITLSGSGNVELTGTSTTLDIASTGSGEIDASACISTDVDVDSSSSGDMRVHATNTVVGTMSGSGDLYITGRPSVQVDQRGSGMVVLQ